MTSGLKQQREPHDQTHGYPSLAKPYLVFVGDVTDPLDAKTATGFVHWRPEWCAGQLRLSTDTVDVGLPEMSITQARDCGISTLLVGVSPLGGGFSPRWIAVMVEALNAGMDIVSGLHQRLSDQPEIAAAIAASQRHVHELRHPAGSFPLGTPRRRPGNRCLTVGSDCCVGKMFTALSLDRALTARGVASRFCATGQTGMMIAESGLCIDGIVSDFISGSLEIVAPDAPENSWQIVEGQGSLFHPSFAGLTLGLVHGAQPDAMVFCHIAGEAAIVDFPTVPLPPIEECLRRYVEAARLINPSARFVGVSANTSKLPATDRQRYLRDLEDRLGLPCVDPVATTIAPIVDHMLEGAATAPEPALG